MYHTSFGSALNLLNPAREFHGYAQSQKNAGTVFSFPAQCVIPHPEGEPATALRDSKRLTVGKKRS
jgi:hypothetical protein